MWYMRQVVIANRGSPVDFLGSHSGRMRVQCLFRLQACDLLVPLLISSQEGAHRAIFLMAGVQLLCVSQLAVDAGPCGCGNVLHFELLTCPFDRSSAF